MSALLSALLVFGLAVFQGGLAQQCQVVVTSQSYIDNQLAPILQALGRLERSNARLEASNTRLENEIDAVQQQLDEFEDGSSPCHAGCSCADILRHNPSARSGRYWVNDEDGVPHNVFCDMTRSCGGITGGWTRVANLDMTNSQHQCPSGLRQITEFSQRTCARHTDGSGCSHVVYNTGRIPYTRVCGRILAYDYRTNDGFNDHGRGTSLTLSSNYVDGVSLTTADNPMEHIWTFAVRTPDCNCGTAPAFINGDYFCDGGDGLLAFLGSSCGRNSCCTLNNPPFFHQTLRRSTSANINMRVCRDQRRSDEDVLLSRVEIYIR